jgi:hypothetical protein
MDFKTQTNHPQQTQSAPQPRVANNGQDGSSKSRGIVALVVGAVVLVVLVIGMLLLWQSVNKSGASSDTAVQKDKFQAVFMTNGQVYFGHLSNLDGGYAKLTNIYYLQVQQAVQPAVEKKDTDQPQVSLTKLGKELHGPTDEMHISRDQILFWENLKDDSTVVDAIKKYQDKQ